MGLGQIIASIVRPPVAYLAINGTPPQIFATALATLRHVGADAVLHGTVAVGNVAQNAMIRQALTWLANGWTPSAVMLSIAQGAPPFGTDRVTALALAAACVEYARTGFGTTGTTGTTIASAQAAARASAVHGIGSYYST